MGYCTRVSVLALTAVSLFTVPAAAAGPNEALRTNIKHVVVIYQENWSFDGLYGKFPGANGLSNAAPLRYQQIDKITGAPLATLPQPTKDRKPDPSFPATLPVQPYDLLTYMVQPSAQTGDLVHRFYQEQSQIDGGKMDKFATWSDNPGLVLSYFDATNMPEGRLAAQYTLADNVFHSAFGGSFLNHQLARMRMHARLSGCALGQGGGARRSPEAATRARRRGQAGCTTGS